MKKIIFILCIFLSFNQICVIAQNIILNPGFENVSSNVTGHDQIYKAVGWNKDCGLNYSSTAGPPNYGYPGTPDLFDKNAPIGSGINCVNVPYNKWATLNERTNQNRYAGFSGGHKKLVNGNVIDFFGETVKGTINEDLIATCQYVISFYSAAIQGYNINGGGTPQYVNPDPNYNKIEVVLRRDGDCTLSKSVYISPNITNTNWTLFSGTFTLTVEEANLDFNRIEFRLLTYPIDYYSTGSHIVFLDDVSLVKTNSPINPDFSISTQYTAGSPTYLIIASVTTIPPLSSFWWEISEVDAVGNVVPNTTLTNPPSWWELQLRYVNPFPGYCCESNIKTGFGTFYYGHRYRITRGTWGPCSSWASISKVVYIGPSGDDGMGPAISTIVDDYNYHPTYEEISQENKKSRSGIPSEALSSEDEQLSLLSYGPNPFTNYFSISYSNHEIKKELSFFLFDFSGTRIDLKDITTDANNTMTVNTTNLSCGIYFLQVCSGGDYKTIKLVKTTL